MRWLCRVFGHRELTEWDDLWEISTCQRCLRRRRVLLIQLQPSSSDGSPEGWR